MLHASKFAAEANDDLFQIADRYPGRFKVAINLPLPHIKPALQELERALNTNQLAPYAALTTERTFTLDDRSFDEIYSRGTALGFPLLLHPDIALCSPAFREYELSKSLGPIVSTTTGLARIVFSGLLDRIDSLDVIAPHLGGALPYLVQRFTDIGNCDAARPLTHYISERLFFDTCSYHPPAFRCALEVAGASQLMMGSDYPFRGTAGHARQDIELVVASPEEQRLILFDNATRWFS